MSYKVLDHATDAFIEVTASSLTEAFEIAGYSKSDIEAKFSGMINALNFGAPPHGGSAPGIDRIIMLSPSKNVCLKRKRFKLFFNR